MKTSKYELGIYPVTLHICSIDSKEKYTSKLKDKLINYLKALDITTSDYVKDILENLKDFHNIGITFSNEDESKILLYFANLTEDRRDNVIDHEKRHAEDKIIKWCDLDGEFEACAYLAGYLKDLIKKHFEQ